MKCQLWNILISALTSTKHIIKMISSGKKLRITDEISVLMGSALACDLKNDRFMLGFRVVAWIKVEQNFPQFSRG